MRFSVKTILLFKKHLKKSILIPIRKKFYEVILKIQGSPMPLFPSEEPTVEFHSECRYTVGYFHFIAYRP